MYKPIPDYPKYEINEFGVVRNAETHYVISQRMNRQGYLFVQLINNNKNNIELVHRLVALTFIPNPNYLPYVNHIDECSVHNSAENLEWVSPKENSNHGTRNERIIRDRCFPVNLYYENGILYKQCESIHEAGRFLGVSEAAVRKAIKNKSRTKGYYAKLVNGEIE